MTVSRIGLGVCRAPAGGGHDATFVFGLRHNCFMLSGSLFRSIFAGAQDEQGKAGIEAEMASTMQVG